jgi:hypothetical protein
MNKENQRIIDMLKDWAEKEPNKQIIALSVKRIHKDKNDYEYKIYYDEGIYTGYEMFDVIDNGE